MSETEKKDSRAKKAKSVTIQLSEPLDWGDETITEITIRRPKGKELRTLSASPTMNDLLKIAQKCSGHVSRVFDDMDGEDVLAVVEVVSDFLDSGQETGKVVKF